MLIQSQTSPNSLKTQILQSNDRIFLNDQDCFWRITSGAVDLFALSQGRRRYLFSAKPGDVLFPMAIANQSSSCQLFAQASQTTSLEPLSPDHFQDWLCQEPKVAIAAIETWVTALCNIASNLSPATLPTPIVNSGILDINEVFQPPQGQVFWIRLCQGQGTLLGLPNLPLTPDLEWFPMTGALWLQANSLVELERCHYTHLTQPRTFLNGVLQLQQLLGQLLANQLQQAQKEELERLYRREQINRESLTKTNDEFIRVFQTLTPKQRIELPVASDFDTALLMVSGAVGRALDVTIQPPGASEDWRRLANPLEAIARASHLQIRQISLRDDWWKKDCGPIVMYALDDGRPLALLPQGEATYEVYDPIHQTRTKVGQTLASQLSTTAYTFYRSFPNVLQPVDLLRFAIHGHVKEVGIVLVVGIVTTLLGMVTPQATALLVDQAIPNANRQLVWEMGLGLTAIAIGSTLFQMTQGFAIMRLETYADSATQSAVWDRLLKLKPSFFRQYTSGELSSRVSAISQIRQRLGSTVLKSLFSGVFSFLNLGLLFYYSTPLALIAVLVVGLNITVTIVAGRSTLKKTKLLLERQGKLLGVMMQLINGVTKFRVAGAESRAFAYWGQQYKQQLQLMLSTQGIEDHLTVVNSLLAAITPAALFITASYLISTSTNGLSLPTFLAFNAAFGIFISGATSLSTVVVDLLEVQPIWQRVQPILQAVPEVDSSKANPGRLSGRIAVDHVVFRYRPDGALNLDDVSIHAEPGEFIALVGPSGSGKSTLLRLLLGFDVPESGVISFDGQDLAGLDVKAVRRQLGVVLQNSRLMSASIFENIAGSALISMDEAWEAARMSGLAADVEAMPMGMHTVVSEGGTNLSGGQRQRLLIARALALRPRILLFDEATSALDNRTQQIVSDSLDRLKVTRIVVAHRLSTIRNADRIYVLQNGRLMQQGNFDELAAQPGLFQQLVERQKV
ncbi:MAG: NHLP bacteriocin export ABC transporter permease/ATPase subunit [Leptolyngbyaceae cyanobacterium bins.349]|nr:NHLP bacteriocin export ABC transporter permease/ATPase subunit [Leptolyngbyaceae cyanobacterium bins.349]